MQVRALLHSCSELFYLMFITLGGSSKRLPNLSCIGKLFCPLPLEVQGKAISILNLKMMITSPFLKLMKNGGIFICASDDIETYCLDGSFIDTIHRSFYYSSILF